MVPTAEQYHTCHHGEVLGLVAMETVGRGDDPVWVDQNSSTVTFSIQLNQNLFIKINEDNQLKVILRDPRSSSGSSL